MANRFPLIANSSANQIQELASGDNLDLTGSNIVNVVDITASGDITVGGTLSYDDVTNVDSLGIITARSNLYVTGISSFYGESRVTTVAEKSVVVNGNTATLSYGGSSANVAICTNPSGDVTLNVTNIPTDTTFNNHNLTFAVVVRSTGTARTCKSVTLNGLSKTIRWAGGSLDTALSGVTTSNGYVIQSFTGINTVGSASTTANYEVFGIVSGGFF